VVDLQSTYQGKFIMIDLILIQDRKSGLGLFQYKGETVIIDPSHEELFQGFLSAFQSIIHELKLGNLKQISTEEHHFIIDYGDRGDNAINVIMMFDCVDCVDTLQTKANEIGCEFRKMFGNIKRDSDTMQYEIFREKIEQILQSDTNVCVEMTK